MIRAIFTDEAGLLWAVVAALIGSAALAAVVARRRAAPILLPACAAASTALVLAATLYPLHPGAPAPLLCTVQRDLIAATSSTQGLMNIALFVPAAFSTALLTRRPVGTGVALALLSAAVEAVQAVTPAVGRSCDTGDLWDNSLGAALGCGLAFLWSRRVGPRPLVAGRREAVRGALALAGGVGVVATALVPFVTVVPADATENTQAGPAQRAAAAKAYRDFFGPAAETVSVQFVRGFDGLPGTISTTGAQGSLTLAWPGGEPATGLVGPLPEEAPGELTDAAAVAAATRFARAHFPWALTDSRTSVEVRPDSAGARKVLWRSRVDGVLMPMSLDVIVTGSGQVSSFSARHIDSPVLPEVTVTETTARNTAVAAHPGAVVTGADLVAEPDRNNAWQPHWVVRLTAQQSGGRTRLLLVVVDAATGAVVPAPGR
ncbi:VanZ family protein [Kitasatospora terrestris]|uniref:VanZ-like domain-containing protein n=1 Tax=Kitasatospora terrestris TaxID=258051 RepID=A0ABP9DB32_9ACTN